MTTGKTRNFFLTFGDRLQPLGETTFGCKTIARVAWWEATSLQTVMVRLGPAATTLRQIGEDLQTAS